MSKKVLITLALVLTLFIAVFIGLSIHRARPQTVKPLRGSDSSLWSRMEIKRPADTVVFINENGVWGIEDRPVYRLNKGVVDKIINNIKRLEVKEIISENPDKFGKFEVTEDKGIGIKVFEIDEKKPVFGVIIGKSAQSYEHNFARFVEDENKVYLVSGIRKYLFTQEISSWRDKNITDYGSDSFVSVKFSKNESVYEINPSSNGYTMNGKDVEHEGADKIINTILKLKADSFASDEESADLAGLGLTDKFSLKIILSTVEDEIELTVGNTKNASGRYSLLKKGDETVYLINKSRIDDINNNLDKLISPDKSSK